MKQNVPFIRVLLEGYVNHISVPDRNFTQGSHEHLLSTTMRLGRQAASPLTAARTFEGIAGGKLAGHENMFTLLLHDVFDAPIVRFTLTKAGEPVWFSGVKLRPAGSQTEGIFANCEFVTPDAKGIPHEEISREALLKLEDPEALPAGARLIADRYEAFIGNIHALIAPYFT